MQAADWALSNPENKASQLPEKAQDWYKNKKNSCIYPSLHLKSLIMKQSTPLFTCSLIMVIAVFLSFGASVVKTELPAGKGIETAVVPGFETLTIDEFLALTPGKIRKETGKKLSLKQIIVLKKAQKKIKKSLTGNAAGGKSQLVALLLVVLVGALGIHRFYLGYIGIGIIQLLTMGGCGIWALIDMIRIITGDLQPKDDVYEETL